MNDTLDAARARFARMHEDLTAICGALEGAIVSSWLGNASVGWVWLGGRRGALGGAGLCSAARGALAAPMAGIDCSEIERKRVRRPGDASRRSRPRRRRGSVACTGT